MNEIRLNSAIILINSKKFDIAEKVIDYSPHMMFYNYREKHFLSMLYYKTMNLELSQSEEVTLLNLLSKISSINILNFFIPNSFGATPFKQHPFIHLFLLAGFQFENKGIQNIHYALVHLGAEYKLHRADHLQASFSTLATSCPKSLLHSLLLEFNENTGFHCVSQTKARAILRLHEISGEKEYRLF